MSTTTTPAPVAECINTWCRRAGRHTVGCVASSVTPSRAEEVEEEVEVGDTVVGVGYASGCERIGTVLYTMTATSPAYPSSIVIRDEDGHATRILAEGARRVEVRPLLDVLREHVAAMTAARA